MPGLSLDFGLFIAYIVPGFVTIVGLGLAFPLIESMVKRLDGDHTIGTVFSMSVLALTAGMFVSVIRGGTIDKTFDYWVPHIGSGIQYERIPPDSVHYEHLANAGLREAYLLAERNEKRPYQFYGNVLISLLVGGVAWLWDERKGKRTLRNKALWAIVWFGILLAFYTAERVSYYRFTNAVTRINATAQASAPPT